MAGTAGMPVGTTNTVVGIAGAIMDIAGKRLTLHHIQGPLGVRGRTSDNRLIRQKLGWAPSEPLRQGLEDTYQWIESEVRELRRGEEMSVL